MFWDCLFKELNNFPLQQRECVGCVSLDQSSQLFIVFFLWGEILVKASFSFFWMTLKLWALVQAMLGRLKNNLEMAPLHFRLLSSLCVDLVVDWRRLKAALLVHCIFISFRILLLGKFLTSILSVCESSYRECIGSWLFWRFQEFLLSCCCLYIDTVPRVKAPFFFTAWSRNTCHRNTKNTSTEMHFPEAQESYRSIVGLDFCFKHFIMAEWQYSCSAKFGKAFALLVAVLKVIFRIIFDTLCMPSQPLVSAATSDPTYVCLQKDFNRLPSAADTFSELYDLFRWVSDKVLSNQRANSCQIALCSIHISLKVSLGYWIGRG